jgi:hypothetical protein
VLNEHAINSCLLRPFSDPVCLHRTEYWSLTGSDMLAISSVRRTPYFTKAPPPLPNPSLCLFNTLLGLRLTLTYVVNCIALPRADDAVSRPPPPFYANIPPPPRPSLPPCWASALRRRSVDWKIAVFSVICETMHSMTRGPLPPNLPYRFHHHATMPRLSDRQPRGK